MKKLALLSLLLLLGGIGVWWLKQPLAPEAPDLAATSRPAPAPTPAAPRPTPAATVPRPAAVVFSPGPSAAQPASQMSLTDVLQPGNRIVDPAIGLTMTFPAGWTARNAALRWGKNDGENTIFFSTPDGSEIPSMYYRKYSDGPAFSMENPEATLRDMALQKEASRSAGGQNDYKNDADSFVFRTIDGHPTLSYFATFTRDGEVQAEYFTRILGPNGYVMFFNSGPVNAVKALIPTIAEMAGTVKPP